MVKIFFCSDIHGSERCFRKFLNAARHYAVDTLILGGDVTGKAIVPMVETVGGRYRYTFLGRPCETDADGLNAAVKEIKDAGMYPYPASPEEVAVLERDPDALRATWTRVVVESVEGWLRLAEERLAGSGVRVFISPGNDDEPAVAQALSRSNFVVNPDGGLVDLDDRLVMVSCGYSNVTPWHSPRELSEDDLAAELDRLFALTDPSAGGDVLANIHVPPRDTPIDLAPLLTADMKPVVEAGELRMVGVGSTAVRAAIMKHQPLVALHGHIHESPGAVRLGRTLCLNPGSEYGDGTLRGCLVQIEPERHKIQYRLVVG